MNDRNRETAGSGELVREALNYLTGTTRKRTPEQLLAELQNRFAVSGRARLADLVYEIGKGCVDACPDAAKRTHYRERPRMPEIVAGEVDTMHACLDGVSAPPDLSKLVRATPSADVSLAALDTCVELLRSVEGDSGRQRLLEAYAAIYHGRPDESETLLRSVLDDGRVDAALKPFARVNLALALQRQSKWGEALAVAEEAVEERPENLPARFCLVSSAADLGELDTVVQGVRDIVRMAAESNTELARTFLTDELARMADEVQLDESSLARVREVAAPLVG
jgi:tetratricopeptide (TPR) repeat protein